jgi:hypothetical protein
LYDVYILGIGVPSAVASPVKVTMLSIKEFPEHTAESVQGIMRVSVRVWFTGGEIAVTTVAPDKDIVVKDLIRTDGYSQKKQLTVRTS